MKKIITTPRLYLREFISEDAEAFYRLNLDEEVIRYTGDKPFASIEEARDFILKYTAYQDYGIGRWAVVLKETNEFIGFCGLKYLREKRYVEVGFRLLKHFWSKGYAKEAATAAVEYGFSTKVYPSIYAHTDVRNTGSAAVLEKIGFTLQKEIIYDGVEAFLFKKDNPYLSIKAVDSKETYPVRHPVLRKGRPIEDCAFEGDDEITTLHLALFFKERMIGVITLIDRRNPTLPFGRQYQLRGMAIIEEYQRKGLGNLLLKESEIRLTKALTNIIWFNAREKAIPFYERAGYKTIGERFEIEGIGMHHCMVRTLY
ncbi:hypothetical protein GCM10009117_23580 [Gangjinia marincola]|uniref:N-acetyltransferase domain-containing protein n=1 Tax=Gangjinia marincola TaxID=578463 RepID=A0ABN1MJ26_9FLAO